jgi:hypothetical protein
MKSRLVFGKLLFSILLLALAPEAMARATWYVDGVHGSDNNNCKSRQHACKTIGHAISLASSGDSIMVAAATYQENLTIRFSLKIAGSGAQTTIIDGGATNTVMNVGIGQVAVSGLTIQNGYAQYGGGIYNHGALTINNSTITHNHATGRGFGGGGGIYNLGGLTIHNSTVSGNSTALIRFRSGGGIWNGGTLTIKNSTLIGNGAPLGGGIYNQGGLTIDGSTISGNTAPSPYNSGIPATGGGIFNGGAGTLTLNNSTLSGNSATSSGDVNCGRTVGGGGIYSPSATITINNSTLSGNYARNCDGIGYGGGINGSVTVTLQNSIIAYSPYGENCYGTVISYGYNLSSDNTCTFNETGDLNNTNPLFGTLGSHGGPTQTIPLLSGSPAIDAGNPKGCADGNGKLLKTDQRGKPRPDKEDTGGCDMGAYEREKN